MHRRRMIRKRAQCIADVKFCRAGGRQKRTFPSEEMVRLDPPASARMCLLFHVARVLFQHMLNDASSRP